MLSKSKLKSIKTDRKEFNPSYVKSLNFADVTQDPLSTGTWSQELDAFLDLQTIKGLFFNEDWVFITVDLIAEHFSSSPLCIKKETIVGGDCTTEVLDSHPLYDLLERPNPFQDYHSWQYNWAVEYVLMGNAVEWVSDSNKTAVVIPADTVMLDFNKEGELSGYIVNRSASNMQNPISPTDLTIFKTDEIFHQMRPNPASLLWGMSPFLPIRKNVLFNRNTQEYLNQYYLRGATPGVILKMTQNVNEDTALRFLRSFETAHTGRANTRRTLVLPKGVDFETASHSIADQSIIELVDNNKDKILAALKVPKHAVSMAEAGSLGSEEHKQALRFFFKSAVMPLQVKRAKFLTNKFRKRGVLAEDEYIEFDNSAVDFIQEDLFKKAELGEKLLSQWTLNEVRQEVWEKEPIEGGDVLPGISSTPISPFFSLPTETREQASQIPNSLPAETLQDSRPTSLKASKEIIDSKFKNLIEANQKSMQVEIDNKEDKIVELFLSRIATQLELAIIPAVRSELESLPKEKAGTDVPLKLNKNRMRRRTQRELDKLENEIGEKDLADYIEILDSTATKGHEGMIFPNLSQEDLEAVQALRQRNSDKRREILAARGLETFANTSETTTEKIMGIIERGIQDNKTIDQIVGDITENVRSLSPGRATTIARTETLTAVSIGRQAAVEDFKTVFKDEPMVKIWLTANDSKVRDSHRPLDRDIIDVDKSFDNGLDYPRDPKGGPSETINCRCDYMAILKKDVSSLSADHRS